MTIDRKTECSVFPSSHDICLFLQNVCLFRHFNKLDRESVMRSKTTFYVDVWPINFFDPDSANYFDTCCLFLLQLACILNMVGEIQGFFKLDLPQLAPC